MQPNGILSFWVGGSKWLVNTFLKVLPDIHKDVRSDIEMGNECLFGGGGGAGTKDWPR